MSDVLLKVDFLSKKFCRSLKRSLWYGLKDLGSEMLGHRHENNDVLRKNEFWAVKDMSFELKRGECLGLIGHNGAGKTTLLRMLNGLIKPDQGRIEIRGSIGALIALGAGFNPILTGRENIYVNGSVLGLSKSEIDDKIEEVIEFSEMSASIDSPVQNYSSGMTVRLGFATAVLLIQPDILFLDEVLAVGDIGFSIKCLNVVQKLIQKSAVVFVSHNMQLVSMFCTRVIVMGEGMSLFSSQKVEESIDFYYSLFDQGVLVLGSGGAEMLKYSLFVNDRLIDPQAERLRAGDSIDIYLEFRILDADVIAELLISINEISTKTVICYPLIENDFGVHEFSQGQYDVKVPLGALDLNAGKYSFGILLRDKITNKILSSVQCALPFQVIAETLYWSPVVRPTCAKLV